MSNKTKVYIRVGCYADKFKKEGDKYVVNWDNRDHKKLLDSNDDFIFSTDTMEEGLTQLHILTVINEGLIQKITIEEREDKWV